MSRAPRGSGAVRARVCPEGAGLGPALVQQAADDLGLLGDLGAGET